MNFDIYCDESRPDLLSSKNPTSKFMVIGSLWLKTGNRIAYKADFITAYLAETEGSKGRPSTIDLIRSGPKWL